MALDIFDEFGRVLAHFEEIRLFLGGLDFAPAVGALAVYELRGRPERLAGRTVQPFVFALINIALIVELAEDLLDGFDMALVRRADKSL